MNSNLSHLKQNKARMKVHNLKCFFWMATSVYNTCTKSRYNTCTKMPSILCKNRFLNTSLISVKRCTCIQYMYLYASIILRNDHTMVTAPCHTAPQFNVHWTCKTSVWYHVGIRFFCKKCLVCSAKIAFWIRVWFACSCPSRYLLQWNLEISQGLISDIHQSSCK